MQNLSYKNASDLRTRFLKEAIEIHISADPRSVWSLLDASVISKLLYLPALSASSSILWTAWSEKRVVGFILLVDPREVSTFQGHFKLSLNETLQTAKLLLFMPRLLLRSILVKIFTSYHKKKTLEANFEIHSLMVMREWQSRGIGTKLINLIRDDLEAKGFKNTEVCVMTFGDRSKEFYLREGFEIRNKWKIMQMKIYALRRLFK